MLSMESNFLICEATGTEMNLNEINANFSIPSSCSNEPLWCIMKNPLVGNCSIELCDFIGELDVCLTITLTNPYKKCRKLKVAKCVKLEAPFGLNITYLEKANEYLVQFSTIHAAYAVLEDNLIHQLAYRQKSTNWTTTESNVVKLKLLGKEFQPDVTYEMKVRSRPNEVYYSGPWSDWSSSQYFNTSAETSSGINKVLLMTVSIASFFVLFVVILLGPIFWKNRIKAIVWPTIPNHKKTLDKLCNKLRKNSDASFFNPESLGYADIHKVQSIQAKSEVARLQPPSYNPDEEANNLAEPKSNLNPIDHGWLKLPLAYEGMLSTEVKEKLYNGSGDAIADRSDLSINLYNEGRTPDPHSWSSRDLCKYSIVPLDHFPPSELRTGSCDHTYSNGETRVLNKEETYVTMASFFENKGKL
ncbi:interleukin-7 receptor subunit alpha isoform X2 [Erythrolamprus reginae]